MSWIDMVYEYDGSYNGFLCCIFESYINREFPIAFVSNEEFPALSLYSVRNVETVLAHSNRVLRSITDRSPRAARLLYRAFHTCMDNREICLYRFVQKLYADGPQFLRRPSDEACFPLYKAVRHLSGELEKLRGFVRFSDYSGVLGAEIQPKNRVLPFLRSHFCSRYANESFFLYDRTHGELLLYSGGCSRIVQADSLILAPPDGQEVQYRKLWKTFFDTVAIEERCNTRCQNTFLPKRYRSVMTEFQSENAFNPGASPANEPLPSAPDGTPALEIHPGSGPPAPGSCT
ncbi:MAG: TIGR03915 family putative DNA repair protein [Clostridiales bacterium]|nr:TIGR03915 family putative DNA repair protein [Clostridiales bacterium]